MIDDSNINAGESKNKSLPPVVARGRLKEARIWNGLRGWKIWPKGSPLGWAADHVYLASPHNWQHHLRRWCARWAPWLTQSELSELISSTAESNKRWTADQCAVALDVTLDDRNRLGFRFIGADDDPNYDRRRDTNQEKTNARARKYRAKNRSGAPRGRPRLQLTAEEMEIRKKEQNAKRAREYRAKKAAVREHDASPLNASRCIESIEDIRCSVTDFCVTDLNSHCAERLQRDGATDSSGMWWLDADLDGDGVGFGPPPRPAPSQPPI
ncbi:hypothetical protein ABIB66_007608 [Bradyrhizobium sp. F1.13.3]